MDNVALLTEDLFLLMPIVCGHIPELDDRKATHAAAIVSIEDILEDVCPRAIPSRLDGPVKGIQMCQHLAFGHTVSQGL